MGRAELIHDRFTDNTLRVANADALDPIVGDWIAENTLDDVVALLQANEVPAGPINNIADLRDDPHVIAREMVVAAPDGDGDTLEMEGIFPKLSRTPGAVRHAGGEMGADNAEVFEAIGLSAAEIAALERDGII